MTVVLVILAALILASAALAMSLRNLIHSALLLTFTWAGVAGFYLWAGAEFIAFAQLLIYVGAISMVVLFAVLLTQRPPLPRIDLPASRRRAAAAIVVGAAVAAVLSAAVLSTPFDPVPANAEAPRVTVRELGHLLMDSHVASLLVVGVLLTVALIGATILAATDAPEPPAHRGTGVPPVSWHGHLAHDGSAERSPRATRPCHVANHPESEMRPIPPP